MKLSGYLVILGACLCGQFFASAQPASNETTNLLGPKVFVFSGGNFNMFVTAGVIRVDGATNFSGGSNCLMHFYDDDINHAIQSTPFELMIDSQTEIVAR